MDRFLNWIRKFQRDNVNTADIIMIRIIKSMILISGIGNAPITALVLRGRVDYG